MLQPADGVGVPHVVLPVSPPLVVAAGLKVETACQRKLLECGFVTLAALQFDLVYSNAAYSRWRPGEILVDELGVQAHRLEYLRAPVALDGRYTHLGHYLQNALIRRLHIVVLGGLVVHNPRQIAIFADHIPDGLERKIRIDRDRSVANQQCQVRHFTRLARFHYQAHFRANALPYQMVMHTRHGKQARYRRVVDINPPVRQDDYCVAFLNRLIRLFAYSPHGTSKRSVVLVGCEQRAYRLRLQSRHVDAAHLLQLGIRQHRTLYAQCAALPRRLREQVALAARSGFQRSNQLFPDCVQRRIANLRKQLLEVIEQHRTLLRQHGKRRVVAHRTYRFSAVLCHRLHNHAQVFERVAERDLSRKQNIAAEGRLLRNLRQFIK